MVLTNSVVCYSGNPIFLSSFLENDCLPGALSLNISLIKNSDSDVQCITLKFLSIGTPKTINFPFVSNEQLMVFRCPNI